MKKQIVKFIVNKNLDIANNFIALNSYKWNKGQKFAQQNDEKYEKLLKMSLTRQREEIRKDIEIFYKNKNKLNSIAQDINREWAKIEKAFIRKLEKIHNKPFTFKAVRGILSSASRFGYDVDKRWFAVSMFRNKYAAIDTATHELMHFMFYKHYWQICEKRGLSKSKIWDIKESFSELLNLEFNKFRFRSDEGYPPHKKIREAIRKSWKKNRDFDKALESAIRVVR